MLVSGPVGTSVMRRPSGSAAMARCIATTAGSGSSARVETGSTTSPRPIAP